MNAESGRSDLGDRPVAEVDRIRDIIFGPQMRVYEQQFKRVLGRLDLLSNQLEELRTAFEQQGAEQESRTRETQEEMRQRHAELERTFTARLDQLEANLELQTHELQAESRQALGQLRDEHARRMDQQAADLKAEARQLSADLRKQGQDLRSEFTTSMDALEDGKTSRHDLGDLLTEMGTRLKEQIGVADLLGQLGQLAEDQSADQA